MRYDFENQLKAEIEEEAQKLTIYKRELARTEALSGSTLKCNSIRGTTYYYNVENNNKKQTKTYIGKSDHPRVIAIQERRFFECAVANIESNLREMKHLAEVYRPIDPNRLRETFPRAYHFDSPRCFELAGTIDEEAWKAQAYRASARHPEHLTHIAADGARVRSKSEVIITNILHSYGLKIRHEEERIFAGMPIAPDFIIYSPKLHREIVWEHFGLMANPRYRRDYVDKMTAFAEAGYYPYVNLIATFDDTDGNIDSQLIDSLAREFFL